MTQPLAFAALCLDCETIFRLSPAGCPACSSSSFIALGAALGDRTKRWIAPASRLRTDKREQEVLHASHR